MVRIEGVDFGFRHGLLEFFYLLPEYVSPVMVSLHWERFIGIRSPQH